MTDQRPAEILTPSQLNTLARDLLEDTFSLVWIEAELGSVSRPSSGHLYVTLKDARAQVRAAMFKPKSSWLPFVPREGMRVLARGRVTLYEARGEYQVVLDHMEEAGEGALRRAFDALKAQLASEGLFEAARKRPLPPFVRRIALVTSPTGAVVRDVLSVLARRFPLVEVDVLPVQVQGAGAAAQILKALQSASDSTRYDVVLLARGGGSLEDLWAFNDEALVRAIAGCGTPVVSAIGHETDFTLADFAADVRAPTPSVAAELLVPHRDDLLRRLDALHARIRALALQRIQSAMQRTDRASLRLQASRPQARIEMLQRRQADALRRLHAAWRQRLERQHAQLRHADAVLRAAHPRRRIERLRERVGALAPRPQAAIARALAGRALQLRGIARSLEAVSPLATVARGYSIVQRADGHVVRRVADVQPGDTVQALVSDGTVRLRVES